MFRAGAKLLVFVLELVKLPIEATLGKELLVSSAFAKVPLMHDQNGVGPLDGGEAMRNEN
jgi:hypothetical protein